MDKTPMILVIDDNKDDCELYKRSLAEAFGNVFRIVEAGSGESGIQAIEKHEPQCVLLDYSLPGHNGIEVLKRIRGKRTFLPVIMLTGQGNETVAVESMKEGAQDYIAKSVITPDVLHRVIRVAMEHTALQKSLAEQRASLEIFTRALAHDLKEPVRTISSFLNRITDWNLLCEKSQKSFRYISKAADRMNALIDTVHLYTRLGGAEQMEKNSCNLESVLEEAKENLAQLIGERSATVTHDTLPTVQANRVQMMQLFQNLLVNAIRHSETAVRIHVGVQGDGNNWQLYVRDNGPGIAPEYLDVIFTPFKRLSQRKEEVPGLGLGLAINRKIVEHHNGKLWCESTPGAGATFYFTFPKGEGYAEQEHAKPENIISLNTTTGMVVQPLARILLVDDNESDIELNRIMLVDDARIRCDILTACNGKEALTVLQKAALEGNPVDLILLDINMPGMNGFELLAQIQKEKMNTIIVMCTTSAYDVDKRMAESFGVAGYLTKPPQFLLLKEIIARSQRLRLGQEGDGYALLRAA